MNPPGEVALGIAAGVHDVAPRGSAWGHGDEWVRGALRRGGGGRDGEVDPPYLVRACDGDLGARYPAGGGGGGGGRHGDLAVGGGKEAGRGGFWSGSVGFGRRCGGKLGEILRASRVGGRTFGAGGDE